MSTATERFECIGDLYYRRFGRLRPGKNEAPETYRDSNDEENRNQFDQWFAVKSFTDAVDRIIGLERELEAEHRQDKCSHHEVIIKLRKWRDEWPNERDVDKGYREGLTVAANEIEAAERQAKGEQR